MLLRHRIAAMYLMFRLAWIGVCALTMMAQTRLLTGLPLRPGWLDGFVLGGAVFAYSFTHPDHRIRAAARVAGGLGALCFLMPRFISGEFLPWQLAAPVPAVLWLMYYGMQKPGNRGLRGVPAAKPVIIALVWSWVTVILPVPPEQWAAAIFVFTGRAAFIFALALAYDLADLEYDRRHQLATLVGNLGAARSFIFIYGALFLALLCCAANYFLRTYGLQQAVPLCISLVFSAWWLPFLLRNTAWRKWQKVLIDGLMPLQFIIVSIMEQYTYFYPH